MEVLTRGPLTPREAEAVLWIAAGKTGWEAGQILQIKEHTLTAHARSAAAKLGATNRAHLVARAFVRGILSPINLLLLVIVLQALAPWARPSTMMRPPSRTVTTLRVRSRRQQVEYPAAWPDS
jgi:DNA-binding CsgD family transcriptional regulator